MQAWIHGWIHRRTTLNKALKTVDYLHCKVASSHSLNALHYRKMLYIFSIEKKSTVAACYVARKSKVL